MLKIRTKNKILDLIRLNGRLNNKLLCQYTGFTKATIHQHTKELLLKGLITKDEERYYSIRNASDPSSHIQNSLEGVTHTLRQFTQEAARLDDNPDLESARSSKEGNEAHFNTMRLKSIDQTLKTMKLDISKLGMLLELTLNGRISDLTKEQNRFQVETVTGHLNTLAAELRDVQNRLSMLANDFLKEAIYDYRHDNFDKAMEGVSKIINFCPNFANAYKWRSTMYSELKEYKMALSDINKYIELCPKDFKAFKRRSMIHYMLDNDSKAWDDLYKARELGLKNYDQCLKDLKASSESPQ